MIVPQNQELQLLHPFLKWLFREYKSRELMGHRFWVLALEIEAKWLADFPKEGDYLTLAIWLSNNGACRRCLKSFKDAWDNFIND